MARALLLNATLPALLGILPASAQTASPEPQGLELQVNSFVAGTQSLPDIAFDSSGAFVVVWTSDGQDGSYQGVFGRRFGSLAIPTTGEFQVNTYTSGIQYFPRVAVSGSGDFVVTWVSFTQDGSGRGIFAQRFD